MFAVPNAIVPAVTHRRGAIALYLVSGLSAVVLLMGFMSSMEVSASLRTMERVQAYRLIDMASESCFEEVASQLESSTTGLDFPKRNEHRDLAGVLNWPDTVETPLTAGKMAPNNVTLSAVTVRSSPWLMFQANTPDGSTVSLERGILQM